MEDGRRAVGPKKYEPKLMGDRHHRIIRESLLGKSNKAIAQELGVTPQTVSNARNSEAGRRQMQVLQAGADRAAVELSTTIKQHAEKAVQVIHDLMMNEDAPESVRFRAASDMLDRGGYGAVKETKTLNVHATLTDEQIEELKMNAIEAARMNGLLARPTDSSIIDVTAEVVEVAHE